MSLGFLKLTVSLVTAIFLAEAAATMLEEDDSSRLTGGIYTPACLGQRYINRLRGVGVHINTEILDL
jgi:short subunit dehydrogenase-like uncharacterized protein